MSLALSVLNMGTLDEILDSAPWCELDENHIEARVNECLRLLYGEPLCVAASHYSSEVEFNRHLNKMLFVKSGGDHPSFRSNPEVLLDQIREAGPRQVCQYQFKRNDIVWICRTCQNDETCVQCNACFEGANHDGHEIFFYHSQAGGCCDCGDPDAWQPIGYCAKHGKCHTDVDSVDPKLASVAHIIFDRIAGESAAFATRYGRFQDSSRFEEIHGDTVGPYSVLVLHSDVQDTTAIVNKLERARRAMPEEFLDQTPDDLSLVYARAKESGSALLLMTDDLDFAKIMAETLVECGARVALLDQRTIDQSKLLVFSVKWLAMVSQLSDGICSMICAAFSNERLCDLMRSDALIPKQLGDEIHSLYLTLMANQAFKSKVAMAYSQVIEEYATQYGGGVGNSETSLFAISVQFLNRFSIVEEMEKRHGFLKKLSSSLAGMLSHLCTVTSTESGSTQVKHNLNHDVLSHRRYNPIIGDLRVVFSLDSIPREFCKTCMDDWYQVLMMFHMMHKQVKITHGHIGVEEKHWMHAFNLSLSLSSLFDPMLQWIKVKWEGCDDQIPTQEELESVYGALFNREHIYGWGEQLKDMHENGAKFVNTVLWKNGYPTALSLLFDTYQLLVGLQAPYHHSVESIPSNDVGLLWWDTAVQTHEATSVSFRLENSTIYSFHSLPFRFLGTIIRESCAYEHQVASLNFFLEYLSDELERSPSRARAFVDVSLRQLCFAAQVSADLWVRNGNSMNDQVLNYTEAPYCRTFRDVDIILVQFAAIYYKSAIVQHLMLRYELLPKAMIDKWITSEINVNIIDGGFCSLRTAFLTKFEESPALLQDLLNIVVTLITELPLAPVQDEDSIQERVSVMMQREIVHKLAYRNCPYSELQDCTLIVADHDKASSDVVDDIINRVSEHTNSNRMEPSMRALKRECWDMYVATFPHLSHRMHEEIIGRRPKLTTSTPIIQRPGVPHHPLFTGVPSTLLFDGHLLALVHSLLYVCASTRCASKDVHKYKLPPTCVLKCSDSNLSAVVTLVTLMIHEVEGPDKASESRRLAEFMLAEELLQSYSHSNGGMGIGSGDGSDEDKNESVATEMQGPSDEVQALVCPLECLMELFRALKKERAGNMEFWVKWTVDEAAKLSDKCRAKVHECELSLNLNLTSNNIDRQRAQRRKNSLMQRMQQQREAFSRNAAESDLMDVDSESDSASGTASGVGTSRRRSRGDMSDSGESKAHTDECEDLQCVTCHEKKDDTLGFLSFSQSSRVRLHTDYSGTDIGSVLSASYDPPEGPERTVANLYIQQCGHVMHFSCFDTYLARQVSRSEQQDDLIVDTGRLQFQCPLCKRLGNFIMPILSSKTLRKCKRPKAESLVDAAPGGKGEGRDEFRGDQTDREGLNWRSWMTTTGGPLLCTPIAPDATADDGAFDGASADAPVLDACDGAVQIRMAHADGEPSETPQVDFTPMVFEASPTPSMPDSPSSASTSQSLIPHSFLPDVRRFFGLFPYGTSAGDSNNSNSVSDGDVNMAGTTIDGANFTPASPLSDLDDTSNAAVSCRVSLEQERARAEEERRRTRVHRLWMRFLQDACEPLISQKRTGPALIDMPRHIDILLQGIAFTYASDASEHFPGYHLRESSTHDLKHLHHVVTALRQSVRDLGLHHDLHTALMRALVGSEVPADILSAERASDSGNLRGPLLQRSLLENLILGITLMCDDSVDDDWDGTPSPLPTTSSTPPRDTDARRGSQSSVDTSVSTDDPALASQYLLYFHQWLCIARLTQLVVAYCVWLFESPPSPTDLDVMSVSSAGFEQGEEQEHVRQGRDQQSGNPWIHQATPTLSDVSPAPREDCSSTTDGWKPVQLIYSIVRAHLVHVWGRASDAVLPDALPWEVCLELMDHWAQFLDISVHILHRTCPGLVSVADCGSFGASRVTCEKDVSECAADFGVAYETMYSEDSVNHICTIVPKWLEMAVQSDTSSARAVRLQSVSSVLRHRSCRTNLPVLDVLPKSYTTLHGRVAQCVDYEYPAICLACGFVLDAGGKGHCTEHAKACCADGAIFFLVQDCILLLIHGVRASYFPPPYVDEHGERHKNYRGKPLNSDKRRSENIRSLWATHGIPREVVTKRSTSNRVIINRHY